MAQIKIEITYDPSTETLEQAVSSLARKTASVDVDALGEAVVQEVLARLGKNAGTDVKLATKVNDEPAAPTPASTDETHAPAKAEDPAAEETASSQPVASPSDSEEKPVSKTDVRAMATALSKAGKRDLLASIFAKFGSKNLSGIKEADYPALMKELVAANG